MNETILILADDLTGAADTASRCRAAGLPATIFLAPPHPPLPAGVISFTSDSRHLPPEEAARRVGEVAAPLVGESALWYKKIDSTLRGNIGAELDALLELLAAPAALVCPAFPAQGRGLVNGHLVAPGGPPVGIHLPSLMREQSRYPVLSFSLADVRSGELAERFHRKDAKGQRRGERGGRSILVVDGTTDEDLGQIVDATESIPGLLLCGSAGLIGEVAKRQAGGKDLPGFGKPGRSEGSALVVVGSGSPMAHRQIDGLLAAYPDAERLRVDPGVHTLDISGQATVTLLHQSPPAPGAVLDGPGARQRADSLADAALACIARSGPDLLLLVGGDTAVAVLSRLGVERLTVQAELLPGMPLCAAEVNGRSLRVVMKPGSFGDESTLASLLRIAYSV
jgi:D-threonate/D-erythronate kinase